MELRFEERVDFGGSLSSSENSLDVGGLDLDFFLTSRDDLSTTYSQLAARYDQFETKTTNLDTLFRDGNGVVSLVPSSERSGINLNDTGLDDGVGSDLSTSKSQQREKSSVEIRN